MRKLFTLIALFAICFGAKAETIVDAEVDFSKYTDIADVPRFSWGGAQEAWDRLSIVDGCLHFHSTEVPLNDKGEPTGWMAQWFPIGDVNAEVGVTYTLHYKIKGDHEENISALGFGQTPYGQLPVTTEWVEGTFDFECTEANGNILMQAGNYIGDFDIAYLRITHEGKKVQRLGRNSLPTVMQKRLGMMPISDSTIRKRTTPLVYGVRKRVLM